jgi:hypothetical protein
MENRDLLLALAGVAATFIGFAGVVFAVDRSSHRGISGPERTTLLHLLLPSIAVLFLAFGPAVWFAGFGPRDQSWRLANGVLGIVHLALIANATRAAIRSRLLEPIPLRFVLIPGGYLAVAANVAVVLGFLPGYGATPRRTCLVSVRVGRAVRHVDISSHGRHLTSACCCRGRRAAMK